MKIKIKMNEDKNEIKEFNNWNKLKVKILNV